MHVKPTKALSGIGIAALIAGGVAGASMLRSSAIAGEVKLTAIPDADINPLTTLWDALVNVVDPTALTQI
jgi:hypothetical protein